MNRLEGGLLKRGRFGYKIWYGSVCRRGRWEKKRKRSWGVGGDEDSKK